MDLNSQYLAQLQLVRASGDDVVKRTEHFRELHRQKLSPLDVLPLQWDNIWYHPIGCSTLDRASIETQLSNRVNKVALTQLVFSSWSRNREAFEQKFKHSFQTKTDLLAEIALTPLRSDVAEDSGAHQYWNKFFLTSALHDRMLWLLHNAGSITPSHPVAMPCHDSSSVSLTDKKVCGLIKAGDAWPADIYRYSKAFAEAGYLDDQTHDVPSELAVSNISHDAVILDDQVSHSLWTGIKKGNSKAHLAKVDAAFHHAALAVRAILTVCLICVCDFISHLALQSKSAVGEIPVHASLT